MMTSERVQISGVGSALLYGLGGAVVLVGLALLAGGITLIAYGGSWYFALMGAALVASGVLIFRRNPMGAWVYGAAMIASII